MSIGIQMLGNTALMGERKTAFLASRRVEPSAVMRCYDWAGEMRKTGRCVIGGFQSALEGDVLKLLLPAGGPPIIMVLARGLWKTVPMKFREAMASGRMLVVSPFAGGVKRVSQETAQTRNRWILEHCDDVYFGAIDPIGSLARLAAEYGFGS